MYDLNFLFTFPGGLPMEAGSIRPPTERASKYTSKIFGNVQLRLFKGDSSMRFMTEEEL